MPETGRAPGLRPGPSSRTVSCRVSPCREADTSTVVGGEDAHRLGGREAGHDEWSTGTGGDVGLAVGTGPDHARDGRPLHRGELVHAQTDRGRGVHADALRERPRGERPLGQVRSDAVRDPGHHDQAVAERLEVDPEVAPPLLDAERHRGPVVVERAPRPARLE